MTLRDSGLREELGLIVIAIKKSSGEMVYNPAAEARIDAGDSLVVMGPAASLQRARASAADRGHRVTSSGSGWRKLSRQGRQMDLSSLHFASFAPWRPGIRPIHSPLPLFKRGCAFLRFAKRPSSPAASGAGSALASELRQG